MVTALTPTEVSGAADNSGRAYATTATTKAGDIVQVDGGFTCMAEGAAATVESDCGGLFVSCNEGHHYLDGQIEGCTYVGVYPAGAAFTSGPWRTEIDNVFAGPFDDSTYVADCAPLGGPDAGRPEQVANARLIAAAPELLDLLQRFVAMDGRNNLSHLKDMARVIIAKATGAA